MLQAAIDAPELSNFKRLARELEVLPLLAQLEKHPRIWREITARQTTPGSPHADTDCVILRWSARQSVDAAFNDLESVDYPTLGKLPAARPLIAEVVKQSEGHELGRALIARLKPGGFIDPHTDEGAYADHFERFHVVLQADEGNLFRAGSESARMRTGELWWFNHKLEHEVFNASDRSRLHLIVDVVAPAYRRERDALPA